MTRKTDILEVIRKNHALQAILKKLGLMPLQLTLVCIEVKSLDEKKKRFVWAVKLQNPLTDLLSSLKEIDDVAIYPPAGVVRINFETSS